MFNEILAIMNFVINAFLHLWPYLLITIPLAVAVQMSGASKYINRAFQARPMMAIFLATIVGAFSPFCSCSVIPVVASLLIGGVPLAPVMAFWIASPSMDPEIFFLSVATIGWELAIWRMVATLILSLSAGFITHVIIRQGWLGHSILRTQRVTTVQSGWALVKQGWQSLKSRLTFSPALGFAAGSANLATEKVGCASAEVSTLVKMPTLAKVALVDRMPPAAIAATASGQISTVAPRLPTLSAPTTSCNSTCDSTGESIEAGSCSVEPISFRQRLLNESWAATTMVVKFMALAYFLEALIVLYIPSEWITELLGPQNPLAILTAALIGIPVYTSNLAALPMVSGLLAQGMNPAAGLAFLIAGPTTTLPAMAAVWGLTTRRVFALYVSFSLAGAVVLGHIYHLVSGFGF
jgi:uncharacterized membrane protein YraQ (UPF0718 family)